MKMIKVTVEVLAEFEHPGKVTPGRTMPYEMFINPEMIAQASMGNDGKWRIFMAGGPTLTMSEAEGNRVLFGDDEETMTAAEADAISRAMWRARSEIEAAAPAEPLPAFNPPTRDELIAAVRQRFIDEPHASVRLMKQVHESGDILFPVVIRGRNYHAKLTASRGQT